MGILVGKLRVIGVNAGVIDVVGLGILHLGILFELGTDGTDIFGGSQKVEPRQLGVPQTLRGRRRFSCGCDTEPAQFLTLGCILIFQPLVDALEHRRSF